MFIYLWNKIINIYLYIVFDYIVYIDMNENNKMMIYIFYLNVV